MSDVLIKWCRRSTTSQQFLDQVETFSAAGVALIHPVRQTGVLLDVDGNDVPAGLEEIAGLIGRRTSTMVNVEWWLSADTNLVCMYYFLPGGREVQTYYLDGMLLDELALVKDLLCSQFWADPGVSESLVVDGTGRTVEFDWDGYLLYGVGRPPEPDLLIVRANLRDRGEFVVLGYPKLTTIMGERDGGLASHREHSEAASAWPI